MLLEQLGNPGNAVYWPYILWGEGELARLPLGVASVLLGQHVHVASTNHHLKTTVVDYTLSEQLKETGLANSDAAAAILKQALRLHRIAHLAKTGVRHITALVASDDEPKQRAIGQFLDILTPASVITAGKMKHGLDDPHNLARNGRPQAVYTLPYEDAAARLELHDIAEELAPPPAPSPHPNESAPIIDPA